MRRKSRTPLAAAVNEMEGPAFMAKLGKFLALQGQAAQGGKRPVAGWPGLGQALGHQPAQGLRQHLPAQVEAGIQALERFRRRAGGGSGVVECQGFQEKQRERIETAGVTQANQGFNVVQEQMADPESVRAVWSELPPPPGQFAG